MISDKIYKKALESIKQPLYIRDSKFNLLYINPASEKLTGYSLEESLKMKCYEVFEDNEKSCIKPCASGSLCHKKKIKTINGNLIEVKCSISQISPGENINGYIILLEELREENIKTDYKEDAPSEDRNALPAKKYKISINNAPDGIFTINSLGNFLEVNKALCNITGYSRDELIKMSVLDLVGEKQLGLKHFNTAIEMGKTGGEISCIRKDGSRCILFMEIIKVFEDTYTGYCKNITKSVQLDKDLIRARGFLHKVINTVSDPIFVKSEEHKWIILNDAYCKLMGYRREDLLGKSDYDFFPAEEAKVFLEKDKQVFSGKITNENIEYFTNAKGKTHTILTKKSIFTDIDKRKFLVGTIRDVTEIKKAEEERIRLVTAIEHAAECIIVTDEKGLIQYVNPAFEKITGYTKKEILGKNISIIESKKHDEDYYKSIWNTITLGEVWTGTFINLKKDGSLYEVEASISPIFNEEEEIINYVCVERDVTDENRLKKHLRQSQKMEAIGTLAGGIAHDFNNILAIIMGYTEMIIKKTRKDKPDKRHLENILKAAERGQNLVKQILTFSRHSDKEWKPVRMSPIVKEAMNFLRASLPSTIKIHKNIRASSGMISGDPTQIHQVLINLCNNSAHSMKEKGGILKVTLENVEVAPEDLGNYPELSPGSYLELTVSDTGDGMNGAVMERIFEPFFSTKSPAEGTGMGLAVVHGIVKAHRGSINVLSELGKGSTFRIMFPRINSGEISKREEHINISRGKGRILFIDDEEDLVYLEKTKLEALGYEVVAKTDSLKALEIFSKDPDFDLIITDQTMPNLTGLELSRKVLKINPSLPVIICTGFSDLLSPEEVKKAGIEKLLMKPVKTSTLVDTIKKTLDSRKNFTITG